MIFYFIVNIPSFYTTSQISVLEFNFVLPSLTVKSTFMKQNKPPLRMFSTCFLFLYFAFSTKISAQTNTSLQKVKQYVAENQQRLGVSPEDLPTLFVNHEYTDASTGIHHIYAAQKINGITITGSHFSLHTTSNKQFDANQMVSTRLYNIKALVVNVSSSNAILKLMDAINYGAEKSLKSKLPLRERIRLRFTKEETHHFGIFL